jgi:tetratricopeptide (TPR) repeat protein
MIGGRRRFGACLFFMPRFFHLALAVLLPCGFLSVAMHAQVANKAPASDASASGKQAVNLAKAGRCREALPGLKRAAQHGADATLKRDVGFAGVRCAMAINEGEAAIDFLRFLKREFPRDPDVLYVTVHTYSDLSTRAALELGSTAPASPEAHQLNAEALEVQGKWDEAEKEYRLILTQNPNMPGIHYRLGRILLSKPDFSPAVAEQAKAEFQQELAIDPSNAGAEYVLGALARQNQQWDEAIQHFSQAAKLDAGFGDAFLDLGVSLVTVKKYSEAIPPLETAVKLEPQNPTAHYNLAVAYRRGGRQTDADREFAIHRKMTEQNGAGQPGSPQENPN